MPTLRFKKDFLGSDTRIPTGHYKLHIQENTLAELDLSSLELRVQTYLASQDSPVAIQEPLHTLGADNSV